MQIAFLRISENWFSIPNSFMAVALSVGTGPSYLCPEQDRCSLRHGTYGGFSSERLVRDGAVWAAKPSN